MFLVVIDIFSKWIYVKYMLNITTTTTIKVLLEYFAVQEIPKKLVTDNGPSLFSILMENFLRNTTTTTGDTKQMSGKSELNNFVFLQQYTSIHRQSYPTALSG